MHESACAFRGCDRAWTAAHTPSYVDPGFVCITVCVCVCVCVSVCVCECVVCVCVRYNKCHSVRSNSWV